MHRRLITAQKCLSRLSGLNEPSAAAPASKGSSGISGGAIAGIVIGVLAGLAILAVLAFFVLKRRRRRSSSLPVVTTDAKASKGYEGGAGEQVDGLGALPQLPTSLQPGTNPFLPSMLSWKPDEGVVKSNEDPSFPAIRSLREVVFWKFLAFLSAMRLRRLWS